MDWATILYGVIGFITFIISMFVAMNVIGDFKRGTDLSNGNSGFLFIIGLFCGVLWPIFIPVALLYYAYTWLLRGLVFLNDKRFQKWITLQDMKWVQMLWDSRLKKEKEGSARCTYCHGSLQRSPHLMTWEPCQNSECLTIFSMDEDAKKIYEQLVEKERFVAKQQSGTWTPTPFTSIPNTSVGGWGSSTTNIPSTSITYTNTDYNHRASTTASLDSYDSYVRQRHHDIDKAIEDNKEPWTDNDIVFTETEKSA